MTTATVQKKNIVMNTFIRIKQSKKEKKKKNITHLSLHNQQTTGTLIQQLDTTA